MSAGGTYRLSKIKWFTFWMSHDYMHFYIEYNEKQKPINYWIWLDETHGNCIFISDEKRFSSRAKNKKKKNSLAYYYINIIGL